MTVAIDSADSTNINAFNSFDQPDRVTVNPHEVAVEGGRLRLGPGFTNATIISSPCLGAEMDRSGDLPAAAVDLPAAPASRSRRRGILLRSAQTRAAHARPPVADGSSDVHVMLHVKRLDGLTIAASENKFITRIAARAILSDDALSVLAPILEDIVGWNSTRIRSFFEVDGFVLRDWNKVRTESLTIASAAG